MIGIVLNEFLGMVESKYGNEVVDNIISESNLQSDGKFSPIENYDTKELNLLCTKLSSITNTSIENLTYDFGKYLFYSFIGFYPKSIENISSTIELIMSVENLIHYEVKKHYEDTELPRFEILEHSENLLKFNYISSRKLYKLAEGLIYSAGEYFKEKLVINYELIHQDGSKVLFTISKI